MAQPAITRFEWETKVAVSALKKLGVNKEDIILVFSYVDKDSKKVSKTLDDFGATTFLFSDTRTNSERAYIPSLKPYLMYRYLSEVNDKDETYVFMDSDVLITNNEFTNQLHPSNVSWYGSNVGGYLNYDYIVQCDKGDKILNEMANIVGVDPEWVKKINNNTIGAQYMINNPSYQYFYKTYKDSIKLWEYIEPIETNYQKWCQEMVATLWNMRVFDVEPKVAESMTFSWATDEYSRVAETNIFHNAGIVDNNGKEFFKGIYVDNYPSKRDLIINSGKGSDYYATEALSALY